MHIEVDSIYLSSSLLEQMFDYLTTPGPYGKSSLVKQRLSLTQDGKEKNTDIITAFLLESLTDKCSTYF